MPVQPDLKKVRHPWAEWFGRKKVVLVRGKHFLCQPHSMAVQIRAAARRQRLHVKVEIEESVITATVLGKTKR